MNLIPGIQGGIGGVGGIGGLEAGKTTSGASESSGGSFAEMLEGLQSYEQQGANALTDLSAAREMDLHDVVIAAEMESLAFNLAGILGGSLAPYIATALAADYGIAAVGYYLTAAGALTLVALIMIARTSAHDERAPAAAEPRPARAQAQ